jgi:hypothetical protein
MLSANFLSVGTTTDPGILSKSHVQCQIMENAPLQDVRLKRLRQLSEEYGLSVQSLPSPKPKPDHPPSYRTDNDVSIAEELLKRQRIADSQHLSFKGGLSRAFTTKKTPWEYREIYDALVAHVTDQGSPGVAEARKQLSELFYSYFSHIWTTNDPVRSNIIFYKLVTVSRRF